MPISRLQGHFSVLQVSNSRLTVMSIAGSEALVVFLIGYPFITLLRKYLA